MEILGWQFTPFMKDSRHAESVFGPKIYQNYHVFCVCDMCFCVLLETAVLK